MRARRLTLALMMIFGLFLFVAGCSESASDDAAAPDVDSAIEAAEAVAEPATQADD